ncbi:MAG: PAS domain-containing protein [Thermoflexales bacterium]|nr:PAS domain-containing protein [Thermoflexales bacterium]
MTAYRRLRHWLSPPIFEGDEDKTRAAGLLHVILLTLFLVLAVLTLFVTHPRTVGISALTAASALGLWFFMRRGYVHAISLLLLIALWLSVTLTIYFNGTIRAPIASAYVAGVVIAGLLLGRRAALAYCTLSSLTLWLLFRAELGGQLPPIFYQSVEIVQWATYAAVLITVAVLLVLATGSINEALGRARRQEAALAERNCEMQAEIAERQRAEASVLRLQHLLQNITDSMPSALITLNPDGRVLAWNPAAEALLDRPATQVQDQLLWQSCPELSHYRDLFEQALRQGHVVGQHKERLVVGSKSVYCDVDVFPLLTNDIEGAVLRLDDVTRRMQLEDMMLQSAKMASVGGLAAGMAHEINNPLSAMMQSAQVLQLALDPQRPRARERLLACGIRPEALERYLREGGLQDYLSGIRDTGQRAAKIISDLLTFSRRDTSETAPHDLNYLLEQTMALASADYDLKKKYDFRAIELVWQLCPDLPQVPCNGQQIQQVLLNLVRNAAQAMAGQIETTDRDREKEKGRAWKPRLTLRTLHGGKIKNQKSEVENLTWVRLELEDNGPGFPEAAMGRLFEPFFTTKQVGEGTGLGLWLCWSIVVERHKGRIWAEPAPGGGARFVIELPTDPKDGVKG